MLLIMFETIYNIEISDAIHSIPHYSSWSRNLGLDIDISGINVK